MSKHEKLLAFMVVIAAEKGHKGCGHRFRQCAVAYSDFWSAYEEVFPCKRHQTVGKESGKTM